jgi:hypothetical protein
MWADYQVGNFFFEKGLSNEEFISSTLKLLAQWDSVWFVEDKSSQYASGNGPIAILGVRTDGWRVEPHLHHFSWSTTRQKLRAWASVLAMLKNSDEIGLILLMVEEKHQKFFDRFVKYNLLFPKGRVSNGLPTGGGFLYTIKGKKQCLGSSQPSLSPAR